MVVDAVAPGVAPSVRFEQVLDHGRSVVALIEIDGASIDDQWPSWMIGDETVVLEADGGGLRAYTRSGAFRLPGRWSPVARSAYCFRYSRTGTIVLL
jgi:hypothetical protein